MFLDKFEKIEPLNEVNLKPGINPFVHAGTLKNDVIQREGRGVGFL